MTAGLLPRRRFWLARTWLCGVAVVLFGLWVTVGRAEAPPDATTSSAAGTSARPAAATSGGSLRPESVGAAEVLRLSSTPLTYPVSAKILRYAERLVKQYDTNGNGRLEQDEWEKMHGNPKAMDANRDGVITTEDLARYIARYGRAHRLQLMISPPPAPETAASPPLFQPASKGSLQQSPTAVLPGSVARDDENAADDAQAAEADPAAATPGESASPTPRPWKRPPRAVQQKFFTSPRNLPPGTPQWFRLRDLDGDGQVSLSEFAPSPTQSDLLEFSRYDVDRDGVISVEDFKRLNRSGLIAPQAAAGAAAVGKVRAAPSSPAATGKRRADR